MGKPFDTRVVATAQLINIVVNFNPMGSGNPTVWGIQISASFICFDANNTSIGIVQSSNGGKIPYYQLMSGLTVQPTMQQTATALFSNQVAFMLWVAQQIYNLSGIITTGYKLNSDGVTISLA